MAKRYSRAELEYLRASPLVAKPTSLPPTEEWMGPLPDPHQKKPIRSNLPLHSVPEDIVLGPPRTAFASAGGARNQNKAFDLSNWQSLGAPGDDTASGDRQSSKDKYSRPGSRYDQDLEGPEEPRSRNQQHRRMTNDGDSWSSRQPRFSGHDESDRGPRRNGHREHDRDRDSMPDSRTPRGFENHRRDSNNETNETRRSGQGRGRNEPSWYRDDKDTEVFEQRRDHPRMREWRDNRGSRESNLDGARNAKQELDPEWMDEPDVHEKKQAHTQEDFERWKERMKAGNGPAQENAPPPGNQLKGHERTISGISSPAGKPKVETPLVVDSSIDGFFGLWNNPDKKTTSADENQSKSDTTKAKAAKSSKFTNFFGAKPVPTEQEAEAPASNPFAAPADSSSEDREGFQRILQLLDQQQSNPAKEGAAREQVSRRNLPASSGAQLQQHRDSPNLQSLLRPRSNENGGGPIPPNKDSEFLLNLMRQSRPQPNASDPRHNNSSIPPELLPFQNLLVSTPPDLPDTMARAEEVKTLDKLNPTPTRSTDRNRGPPPGLFDRPGPHDSQRMGKEGPEFAPSYISQHVPHRQFVMMPPPGFQAPLRNAAQFPPGLMTNVPSGYGGIRGNPPPGMPPPGFMNAPPPPGFPPLQPPHLNQFFGGPSPRPAGEGFGEALDFGPGQGQFGRRQD